MAKKRDELVTFAKRNRPLLFHGSGLPASVARARGRGKKAQKSRSIWKISVEPMKPLHRVWQGEPSLSGVYFGTTTVLVGGASRGYTMRHKPAAQEMERYFSESAARAAVTFCSLWSARPDLSAIKLDDESSVPDRVVCLWLCPTPKMVKFVASGNCAQLVPSK